ncbi:MAG: fibronectin type III domain-containing protein [Fidelibacterota bacterium]
MSKKEIIFRVVIVVLGIALIRCAQEKDDRIAPEVNVTAPENNAVVSGLYAVRCTAIDNESVVGVKIIIDGNMTDGEAESTNSYRYRWNTTNQEDLSRHVISAQAYDASDNIGLSDSVVCYVDNRGVAPLPVTLAEPQNIGKHSVTLSWTASIDKDFLEYRVFRNSTNVWDGAEILLTSLRNPWQTVYVDNGMNADSSWVTPWGLEENRYYYYRIEVRDTVGLSSNSNIVTALTKLPEAPVLKETYEASKLSATISWYKSSEDVRYYRIHRARVPTVGASLADSIAVRAATQSSYVDTGLTAMTVYYYRVFVVDEAGYSSGSNVLQVSTKGIGTVNLYTPVGKDVQKHSIRLKWSCSREEDECVYHLYRGDGPGVTDSDCCVASLYQRGDTLFNDQRLEEGHLYYYTVYLEDSRGNRSRSNEIGVRTLILQPIELSAASVEKYRIELRWEQYPDSDFAGYYLYRSTDAGFDTSSAELKRYFRDATVTKFSDEGLNLETDYYYRFFIVDSYGSDAGSELAVQTKGIERVEIKEIVPVNDSYFRVIYTMNRADEDFQYYAIYRSENSNVSSTDLRVGTVHARADTIFDDAVPATQNAEYFYRVYVVDGHNNISTGSNVVGDTLNSPPVPVELSFAGSTTSSIQLRWTLDQNDDFSVYELYRSTKSEFTRRSREARKVATISNKNTTTYTESNLPSGVFYYYCIYVTDIGGESSASNIVSAYTVP